MHSAAGTSPLSNSDPWGFRPLCIGLLPSGGHAVASETGALQTLGCEAIRDVQPGEVVSLSNSALKVMQALPPVTPSAMCVFEHIYFARPDQTWDGINVHHVRQRLGEELAREMAVKEGNHVGDVVIPVPDSSVPAAIGFSHVSGVSYNDGFIKNRYVGRTFIQPSDGARNADVRGSVGAVGRQTNFKNMIRLDVIICRCRCAVGNTGGEDDDPVVAFA